MVLFFKKSWYIGSSRGLKPSKAFSILEVVAKKRTYPEPLGGFQGPVPSLTTPLLALVLRTSKKPRWLSFYLVVLAQSRVFSIQNLDCIWSLRLRAAFFFLQRPRFFARKVGPLTFSMTTGIPVDPGFCGVKERVRLDDVCGAYFGFKDL